MDVVELVKKFNKWKLPETLRWLADQAGMSENGQSLKPQNLSTSGVITEQKRVKL